MFQSAPYWKYRVFHYCITLPLYLVLPRKYYNPLHNWSFDRGWPARSSFVWQTRKEIEGFLAPHGYMVRAYGNEVWAWNFSQELLLAKEDHPTKRWTAASRQTAILLEQIRRGERETLGTEEML